MIDASKYIEELSKEDSPEKVAEILHEIKKTGEQIFFNEKKGRLILSREWDIIEHGLPSKYEEVMKRTSEILGIHDRKSYEEADERYNLTMY